MSKRLQSNWMGHSNASPTLYRAASKGKPFTRAEKVRMIEAERKRKEKVSLCKEMILAEKAKIRDARKRRERVMAGIAERLANPSGVVKRGKDGVFVQSRNEKGHFNPKIAL